MMPLAAGSSIRGLGFDADLEHPRAIEPRLKTEGPATSGG
jgi:hypothetical protein